ncbi:MAG: hypothetical protein J6S67_02255 [Methanobrevibacter sp.]|nr:hypothetical protein [Methanobrevibacter sp.]
MVDKHYRWDFIGLSTDTKPTPETSNKVVDGSTYYTSDDSKLYVWYKDQWYEKEATGGGGGASYTAGDGIDITNDVISATNTGQVRELTTDDYNYPANNPTTVALWLMPAGLYKHASGVRVNVTSLYELPYQAIGMVGASSSTGTPIFIIRQQYDSGGYFVAQYYSVYDANGSYNHEGYIGEPYNKLDSYSSAFPLSANQGRVLNEKIGDLSTLTTTDKTSAVAAINELAQGGGGGAPYGRYELTEADLNWNSSTGDQTQPYDSIALWLMPYGSYYINNASRASADKIPVYVYRTMPSFNTKYSYFAYDVLPDSQQSNQMTINCYGSGGSGDSNGKQMMRQFSVYPSSGDWTWSTYSVATNEQLNDDIKTGDLYDVPTTSTNGTIGRLYKFNDNGTYRLYMCMDYVSGTSEYIWKEVTLT